MTHEKPQTIEDARALMNGLLTTLSHDLRTPLSTINGWLFMLESDKLDAVGKKRALEKIRANIETQVRLIDDVLLLSRSMSGHLQVNTAPISMLVPLAAAMENVRPYAVIGAVSMPPAKVTETATVLADAELLQRVFEIVLAHAITATPKGGAITTSADVHDGKVEITVADNGKGGRPEEIANLFDAFGKAASASGGVSPVDARNLMLTKLLVEKQRGQLLASSPGPGQGTTFTLRMPCIDAQISTVE